MASSEEEERLHEYPNHQRSSRKEENDDDDGWFFFSNDDDESERENADCVRLWVPALVHPVPRGRVQPSTVDREPMARDFERFSVGKRTLPASFG